MPYSFLNFGIVIEQSKKRVTILDTDTMAIQQTLDFPELSPLSLSDVAICSNCRKAVITNTVDRKFIQIDLTKSPPAVITSPQTRYAIPADVEITPDGNYALSTNGLNPNYITIYNLQTNTIDHEQPSDASSIAVSPCNGAGLSLAVSHISSTLKSFVINNNNLVKSSGDFAFFSPGSFPVNITFTPDGRYAFVANMLEKSIDVFSILAPDNILHLSSAATSSFPQTIAASQDGRRIYVLTGAGSYENTGFIDIFEFNPKTGTLAPASPVSSFPTGLFIRGSVGIEQMALDYAEEKIFLIGTKTTSPDSSVLRAFRITGEVIEDIKGIRPQGGIDTSRRVSLPTRGLPFISWAYLT